MAEFNAPAPKSPIANSNNFLLFFCKLLAILFAASVNNFASGLTLLLASAKSATTFSVVAKAKSVEPAAIAPRAFLAIICECLVSASIAPTTAAPVFSTIVATCSSALINFSLPDFGKTIFFGACLSAAIFLSFALKTNFIGTDKVLPTALNPLPMAAKSFFTSAHEDGVKYARWPNASIATKAASATRLKPGAVAVVNKLCRLV